MKNHHTQGLVQELKTAAHAQKAKLWKRVASDLERPTRQRRVVNIFKIQQHAKDGEIIIVPGKVLGEGDFTKKVTVAAHSFSDSALEKINKTGKAVSIKQLMKDNPKGQKVRILG